MTNGMRIGELARRCSVAPGTVRYYEQIGLLPPAPRASNGYRWYSPADARRLEFITQAKSLGLSLDEIRDLLPMADSRDCDSLTEALAAHADARIAWIDGQIRSLRSMRDSLIEFREAGPVRRRCVDSELPCECVKADPDGRR